MNNVIFGYFYHVLYNANCHQALDVLEEYGQEDLYDV